MTKIQGQFRPRKRQYFEKRFLPAYSTGIKVPETRVGKKFLFFQNSIGRSLTINPKYELQYYHHVSITWKNQYDDS